MVDISPLLAPCIVFDWNRFEVLWSEFSPYVVYLSDIFWKLLMDTRVCDMISQFKDSTMVHILKHSTLLDHGSRVAWCLTFPDS